MAERVDFADFGHAAIAARVEEARRRVLEALSPLEAPTKTDADVLCIATFDVVVAWLCARIVEHPETKDTAVNLLLSGALRLARCPDASQIPEEVLQ